MNKADIAQVLEEIADLLELQQANPFRVRAYRNAARTLLNLDQNLQAVIKAGKLTTLPGIGADLAEKITVLATTGRLPFYQKLKSATPPGLLELLQVRGLGPKKVQLLYQKLKIRSIAALKVACEKGQLSKLKGFGAKTARNILDALAHKERYGKRHLWWAAMGLVPNLENFHGFG